MSTSPNSALPHDPWKAGVDPDVRPVPAMQPFKVLAHPPHARKQRQARAIRGKHPKHA